MSLSTDRRVTAVTVGTCAAVGLVSFLILWRSRRKRSAVGQEGLALTSLDDIKEFGSSLLKRLLLARFVRRVDLPSLPAASIPKSWNPLLCFRQLTSLNLCNCNLSEFPVEVAQLTHLKNLNLSRNKINSVPKAIASLSSLEDLDLGKNELASLPEELGSLAKLKTLNVMGNALTSLPESLGNLTNVFRLGLKSNQLRSLPESIGDMKSLVELFITDNKLTTLPPSMGKLAKLFKLQASFNCLESLPADMGHLPNLELFRIAVNNVPSLPDSFINLNRLAWFSLAGNPACAPLPQPHQGLRTFSMDCLSLGEKLGDGASGDVFAAVLIEGEETHEVVFKQFKAETSPDGHCQDEMAISASLDHPNLTRVLGVVENPQGMVLERVYARAMADKPNFDSLLRCRWTIGQTFSLEYVLQVARGVASALEYLHSKGICHGDVYAHNIMTTPHGHAVLCDFGAAFCYDKACPVPFEAHEARAFGLFLKDLHARIEAVPGKEQTTDELQAIARNCIESSAQDRPSFQDIVLMLSVLSC